MNNIFKKGAIVLDDNFSLTPDPDHGLVLNFTEERLKEESIKGNKTGKQVPYQYNSKWYFPSVGMALEKFVTLSGNSSKSIEEVIENSKKTMDIVKEFRTKYKNWN